MAEDFDATLRARERSDATRRAYRSDLADFVRFATTRSLVAPRDVDRWHLREYFAELAERGVSRATVARRRASLRAYFA